MQLLQAPVGCLADVPPWSAVRGPSRQSRGRRWVAQWTCEGEASTQPEASAWEPTEDKPIVRILADRKAGKDTTKDVELLLRLAGTNNRAALDRLAQ